MDPPISAAPCTGPAGRQVAVARALRTVLVGDRRAVALCHALDTPRLTLAPSDVRRRDKAVRGGPGQGGRHPAAAWTPAGGSQSSCSVLEVSRGLGFRSRWVSGDPGQPPGLFPLCAASSSGSPWTAATSQRPPCDGDRDLDPLVQLRCWEDGRASPPGSSHTCPNAHAERVGLKPGLSWGVGLQAAVVAPSPSLALLLLPDDWAPSHPDGACLIDSICPTVKTLCRCDPAAPRPQSWQTPAKGWAGWGCFPGQVVHCVAVKETRPGLRRAWNPPGQDGLKGEDSQEGICLAHSRLGLILDIQYGPLNHPGSLTGTISNPSTARCGPKTGETE